MNILYCSNWSAFSAYAQQSQLFVRAMQRDGQNVTVFELAGSSRRVYNHDGVTVLSPVHDPLGNDMVVEYAKQVQADAVLSLMDVWRNDPNQWQNVAWYPHLPVDHLPVPPQVAHVSQVARRVIAMSRYGECELRKVGFDPLYVPLAVDNAIFYPQDKAKARRALGLPDNLFIAAFVGVNDSTPSRKGIPELLMAWQLFYRDHPDALLYLHTGINGNLPVNGVGGVNIDRLMATLALNPQSVRLCDQTQYRMGFEQSYVASVYAAADVLVLPSRGEGFGMPLIEAQAVGTPVITTDFTAQSELVFSGWKIGGSLEWAYQEAFLMKPDIHQLNAALAQAYDSRGDDLLRRQAIEGARAYAFETVYSNYMRPALQSIAEDTLARLAA